MLPRLLSRFREERPGVDAGRRWRRSTTPSWPGRRVRPVRPVLRPAPGGRRPVRGPPGARRPVRPASPRPARRGRAAHVGDACARSSGCPLIGFADPDLHERAGRHLRRTGHEPTFVFRSNDNPTIQGFVAAGLGYALMPRLTVDEDDPEVAVVPRGPGCRPRSSASSGTSTASSRRGAPLHRARRRGLRRPQPRLATER